MNDLTPMPPAMLGQVEPKRPPTHAVYQLVEADGEIYRMRVGSGWSGFEGSGVYRVVTIHGEFEIERLSGEHTHH